MRNGPPGLQPPGLCRPVFHGSKSLICPVEVCALTWRLLGSLEQHRCPSAVPRGEGCGFAMTTRCKMQVPLDKPEKTASGVEKQAEPGPSGRSGEAGGDRCRSKLGTEFRVGSWPGPCLAPGHTTQPVRQHQDPTQGDHGGQQSRRQWHWGLWRHFKVRKQ